MDFWPFTGLASWEHKELEDIGTAQGPARIFIMSEDFTLMQSCMQTYGVQDAAATINAFDANGYLMANLWVQQVSFSFAERSFLEPHLNDNFYHFFAGQTPAVANISAHLINPAGDVHKSALILAYKNILRLSAVAKMGITPVFSFVGYSFMGALLSMDINENSNLDGALGVSLQWLIFNVIVQSSDNLSLTGTTGVQFQL